MSYQNSNSFFCQHLLASFPLPKKTTTKIGETPQPRNFPKTPSAAPWRSQYKGFDAIPEAQGLYDPRHEKDIGARGKRWLVMVGVIPPPGEIWKTKPFLTLKKLFNLILWKLMCRVVWALKIKSNKDKLELFGWIQELKFRTFCLKIVFLIKVTRRYAGGELGFFCSCKKCGKSVFIYIYIFT